MLEVKGVFKSFAGLQALADISLRIEAEQITGIIGPNGAGKTTLFNVVSGFIPPDRGRIYYRSRDITKFPAHRMPETGIVRSWQGLRLIYELTVLDNVLMALPKQKGENIFCALFRPRQVAAEGRENRKKALGYLETVHLAEKASELVQNLSYAEHKLLSLARLLATGAEFLMLDEPTSGMDMRTIEEVMFPVIKELRETHRKTICIVEHSIDIIRNLCQWIFFIDQGRLIASGTPEEIISDPELGKIYFGL
ncbi:MAG: ABC transporter ATP-binding protein [Pseudomonadota bacterium]